MYQHNRQEQGLVRPQLRTTDRCHLSNMSVVQATMRITCDTMQYCAIALPPGRPTTIELSQFARNRTCHLVHNMSCLFRGWHWMLTLNIHAAVLMLEEMFMGIATIA